jgi:hypothetical protein
MFTFNNFGQSANALSGRLLTPDLQKGVPRAIVLLINPTGEARYAFTNHFGYFRFVNVPTGITYTINVKHKRYVFEPTIFNNFSDNLNSAGTVNNLIALDK